MLLIWSDKIADVTPGRLAGRSTLLPLAAAAAAADVAVAASISERVMGVY